VYSLASKEVDTQGPDRVSTWLPLTDSVYKPELAAPIDYSKRLESFSELSDQLSLSIFWFVSGV